MEQIIQIRMIWKSKFLKNRNIYGRSLVKIPVPKFVVFYNGDEEQPEAYDMKLSDAFEKKTDNPELELVCKVYNINFGKNEQLLEEEGREELANVIIMLKTGITKESLLKEGIKEELINLAMTLI